MLPYSHDEVVYGKGSMLNKMPGDEWQKFANLRLLYSYMFTHPGSKLLFMGAEFGQGNEWNFQNSLDWHVLQYPNHQGIKEVIKALNQLYKDEPALYEKSFEPNGFEWVDGGNAGDSILIYNRKGTDEANELVIVLNMTPVPRQSSRVGVHQSGKWIEIFNSDAKKFWGSGMENQQPIGTEVVNWHGRENSILINIPPLAAVVLKREKTVTTNRS
jgi:1,4-alpha-glucan branching enzyme